MNTITLSNGKKMNRSQFDTLVRRAKKLVLDNQVMVHGYNFCEDCNRSSGQYLDCSHNESVKSCIENGYAEKAFDVMNIRIRCRECHQKLDKNGIQWTKM